MSLDTGLDERGLPTKAGVYSAVYVWGGWDEEEIEVYEHSIKGLCCFSEDFGSGGTGVDGDYDCHVSVHRTGLKFIKFLRELE